MHLKEALSVILVTDRDVKPGYGEDCYTTGYITGDVPEDDLCYIGVFDGCGGLGARKYDLFKNHTGARVAARMCAYTTDVFMKKRRYHFDCKSADLLKNEMEEFLKKVKSDSSVGGIQIGGSLSKGFPTTVSLIIAKMNEDGKSILCDYLWAGDSRGFWLNQNGLHQITTDDIDTNADDAFENLREDGRLTNVVNADSPCELHRRNLELDGPGILITSTDGGFGYLRTPMEFECLLISTLQQANTPMDWMERIKTTLCKVAGDDFTIAIAAFNFKDFEAMKSYFDNRKSILKRYIVRDADDTELRELWTEYKKTYYKHK